jgi:hypothetical protein
MFILEKRFSLTGLNNLFFIGKIFSKKISIIVLFAI